MPLIHIHSEIMRARQAEIAAAVTQRRHSVPPARRTSSRRSPFAIRLLRRSIGATG